MPAHAQGRLRQCGLPPLAAPVLPGFRGTVELLSTAKGGGVATCGRRRARAGVRAGCCGGSWPAAWSDKARSVVLALSGRVGPDPMVVVPVGFRVACKSEAGQRLRLVPCGQRQRWSAAVVAAVVRIRLIRTGIGVEH